MVDAVTFRAAFPEFGDLTKYPDNQVTFWLGVAALMISAPRWAELTYLGIELFTAHNLALEAPAIATAALGGTPGMSSGIVQSKTLDKGSISYDTTSAIEEDAGHWNLTIYGKRLIRMIRMFGAGGIQL